jgi:hypothetical protein
LTCTAFKPSADSLSNWSRINAIRGRHDDGHAGHEHRRHLIAQRLPRPGRHDGERVPPGQDGVDDRLLPEPQVRNPEHLTNQPRHTRALAV